MSSAHHLLPAQENHSTLAFSVSSGDGPLEKTTSVCRLWNRLQESTTPFFSLVKSRSAVRAASRLFVFIGKLQVKALAAQ